MKTEPVSPLMISRNPVRRLSLLLSFAALVVLFISFISQRSATMQTAQETDYSSRPDAGWTQTGSLAAPRTLHTATLLQNGKVLVAGGETPGGFGTVVTATAEIYDPATGTWVSTGNLNIARSRHTATLLPNGKVVVISGSNGTSSISSVEIYDPTTGSWALAGLLIIGRQGHTVSLLPNGKLLVAGGVFGGTALSELYDPATGTSELSGSFVITSRVNHTATTLPNGKVMVAGGNGIGGPFNTAEIYDQPTGNWNLTGNMVRTHNLHAASLLPSGKVLVSGDLIAFPNSSELYDPVSGTWALTGNLIAGRSEHTSNLLSNGLVLIAGGREAVSGQLPPGSEIYSPSSGTWNSAGNLNTARYQHTSTVLQNGKVLIVGGRNGSTVLTSSELYDSNSVPTPTPTATPTAAPTPTPTPCSPNWVVTNNADDGPGSLRQAIANACPGGTITVSNSVTGAIVLVSDSIFINKSLNIQGPTSGSLVISGNSFYRVINIGGPVTVSLNRLTITGGRSSNGAGIINFDGSTLTLNECTVSGNTISAGAGSGGGIYNFNATINVINSSVSYNQSRSRGAGIGNDGTLNIVNSTISGNTSTDDGPSGGGIHVSSGTANLINVTITGNVANGFNNVGRLAGGILNDRGVVNVRNTLVAGNFTSGGNDIGPDISGVFNSHGYNLIGKNDGSSSFPAGNPNANFDIVGTTAAPVNPLLAPLASNGGPTQTHALLSGSPAIDKGAPATNSATGIPLSTDQRGFTRPFDDPSIPPAGTAGNNSDIGAFELQVLPTTNGIEGDVVDSNGGITGDGAILSNDVSRIRQFALGLATPVIFPNQFQRADINGGCGDGAINSADVTVVRLILLGSIVPSPACGPTAP